MGALGAGDPSGGPCDRWFAAGVGAGLGAFKELNEGIMIRTNCPHPVDPASCTEGRNLARDAIAAYRRAPEPSR